MSIWCSLFGHNYSVTSTYGNYAFCSKCGAPLTIKEPHILVPGERRWINGKLMEMNELNMLEEVEQDDRKILTEDSVTKETTKENYEFSTRASNGADEKKSLQESRQ
jgi:hypothetical protein